MSSFQSYHEDSQTNTYCTSWECLILSYCRIPDSQIYMIVFRSRPLEMYLKQYLIFLLVIYTTLHLNSMKTLWSRRLDGWSSRKMHCAWRRLRFRDSTTRAHAATLRTSFSPILYYIIAWSPIMNTLTPGYGLS